MVALLLLQLLLISPVQQCMDAYRAHHYGEAERCFLRLYRDSGDPDYLYGAAYSAYMGRRYRRAMTLLGRLLKLRDNGDIRFLQGLVMEAQGRTLGALQAYRKARRLGLSLEDPRELRRRIGNMERRVRQRRSVRGDLAAHAGYDSKPFASDLGELMTSEEEPAAFVGLRGRVRIPLSVSDSLDSFMLGRLRWRVYADEDSFARGSKGMRAGGRMMNPSEGLFGYGNGAWTVGLRSRSYQLEAGVLVDAYDPWFTSGLVGVLAQARAERSWHGLGTEVDLSLRHTAAYDEAMSPFSGTTAAMVLLQEIPWFGPGSAFMSVGGTLHRLGVSDSLPCEGEGGCPATIEWNLYRIDASVIASWSWGSASLLVGAGWSRIEQTGVTVMEDGTSFSRQDDRLSLSVETEWKGITLGLTWTRSWSNAAYQYYDFNFTRTVVRLSTSF